MTGLLDFVLGTEVLCIPCAARTDVLRVLLDAALPVSRTELGEDGTLLLTVRRKTCRKLSALLTDAGLAVPEVIAHHGLPVYLLWMRKRPGVPVGALLIGLILVLSSLFVWRVDVVCLDNNSAARADDIVDTEAVAKRLASFGIAPGLFLPTFSAQYAEHDYLREQTEVSWMAINRQGTVLSVEVRPARAITEDNTGLLQKGPDGTERGADLVADGDGVIVRYEIRNGTPIVLPEQFVTAGEVLASGVFEAADGDVHFSYASGKVFAKTLRIFRTEIPFLCPESVRTGETEKRYRASFFGKDVTFLEILQNFFANTGISGGEYDIIEEESTWTLPDGTPLPFCVTKETYIGQKTEVRRLSRTEALERAEAETERKISACPDLTVISTEKETEWTDAGVVLTAYVFCTDNIARTAEFSVDGSLHP